MKTWIRIASVLIILLPLAALAQGENEMSAEQAAMMEAWMAAATPGQPHQRLADQTGVWNAAVEVWMEPGSDPEISESRVERVMTLDGRVLEEHWTGRMMGMPFVGHGRTGYDNVTDHYWSTWTDNMSTGLMLFEGRYDTASDRFEFSGSYVDPITGDTVQSRSVSSMPEPGKEEMVMYETRDGTEMRTMRMVLTRE